MNENLYRHILSVAISRAFTFLKLAAISCSPLLQETEQQPSTCGAETETIPSVNSLG